MSQFQAESPSRNTDMLCAECGKVIEDAEVIHAQHPSPSGSIAVTAPVGLVAYRGMPKEKRNPVAYYVVVRSRPATGTFKQAACPLKVSMP